MQTTLDPISEVVVQTKDQVERSSERLAHLLSFVPEDKLAWAPSSTARSPLRLVAHCALTSKCFADIITDRMPGSMPSPEEFFTNLHAGEETIVTRESVLALLHETTAELCDAIGTVNAGTIDSTRNSPFGPLPMRFWLEQAGTHLTVHAGQLAYLQTIWGDLDNHMG